MRKRPGEAPPDQSAPDTASNAGEITMLMEKARQIISRTPEVRSERVAALKAAIEQGTYKINTRKLADLIIKEWFSGR